MDTGTTEHLQGIWIAPDGSAFAVGEEGTILRFNGSSWSAMDSGTTNVLRDIWGSSSTAVAASGDETVLFYDGDSWTEILSDNSGASYRSVWTPATGEAIFVSKADIFPFVVRYDRSSEEWGPDIELDALALSFCGTSSDVTMVLENGDLVHLDNNLNLTTLYNNPNASLYLQDAWLNPNNCNEAFGVFIADIYHFDGSSWTNMNANIPNTFFFGISGSSSDDVYAVGIGGAGVGVIWHYDGVSWSQEEDIPTVSSSFRFGDRQRICGGGIRSNPCQY